MDPLLRATALPEENSVAGVKPGAAAGPRRAALGSLRTNEGVAARAAPAFSSTPALDDDDIERCTPAPAFEVARAPTAGDCGIARGWLPSRRRARGEAASRGAAALAGALHPALDDAAAAVECASRSAAPAQHVPRGGARSRLRVEPFAVFDDGDSIGGGAGGGDGRGGGGAAPIIADADAFLFDASCGDGDLLDMILL